MTCAGTLGVCLFRCSVSLGDPDRDSGPNVSKLFAVIRERRWETITITPHIPTFFCGGHQRKNRFRIGKIERKTQMQPCSGLLHVPLLFSSSSSPLNNHGSSMFLGPFGSAAAMAVRGCLLLLLAAQAGSVFAFILGGILAVTFAGAGRP